MENRKKYDQAFIDNFAVDEEALAGNLEYSSIPAWDSVGHMGLMASLEDCFGIMMDMDDIIEFGSYEKGLEIVRKYGVEV